MRQVLLAFAVAGAVGFAVGCTVSFPDTLIYSCTKDADCAGDGFKCAAPSGGAGTCCKPDGVEVCDGRDNDCNGVIDDGTFPEESCNGLDDDCDGKIDETFNLITDNANCGRCGKACSASEMCSNGVCLKRGEMVCDDAQDNDDDGKTDCADSDCNLASCGTGCQCRAGHAAEGNCQNGLDDDHDGKTDCMDENCAGAGCGDGGCFCEGGGPSESNCFDGEDNDGDGNIDCADSDCAADLCKSTPQTFRCAGTTCACNDGGVVAETGAALCRDFVDNDCDGLTDCAEAACDQLSCSPDGGAGCLCTGGIRVEKSCNDRKDNDNDGFTDCADALPDGGGDCPIGIACSYLNGSGVVTVGACAADRTCR